MTAPSEITTVIFDLGQVIVTFDHMDLCRRASAYSLHTPEELFERMFSSDLILRFETGVLPAEEFYRKACSLLDLDITCAQFKTLWTTIFTLNTETASIIERLRDYTLLLLSNTNCWHFTYCRENYPVLRHFDAWILSYEIGACKPDRKIFTAALKRAAARPEQCVFIDDIPQYTEAARSLGITAHTFTDAGRLAQYFKSLNILPT
jgi:glucose-1-phosphatase